ncbi:hypothetical protein [Paraburkholderia tropica]|uniref:hypothetical protein n=1 Tax=Paraburkholderia tropica TaxID=92647 RepID=UPI002AB19ED0|nr:hypothetical protein [Paraburkholderia tropica]
MNESDNQRLTGRIHHHLRNFAKRIRANNNHYSLDTEVFNVKHAGGQGGPSEIIASIKVDSPFSNSDDHLTLLRGQFDAISSIEITEEHVKNALLHSASLSASVDLYAHGSERRALHVLHDMLSGKNCGVDKNRMPAFAAFSAAMNSALRHIQTQTLRFSMLTGEETGRTWQVYPEINIEQFVCDVANITLTRSIGSPHQNYRIHYDLNLNFPVEQLNGLKTPSDVTTDFVRVALLAAVESATDAHTAAGDMQRVSIVRELREVFSSMLEEEMFEEAFGDEPANATKTLKI